MEDLLLDHSQLTISTEDFTIVIHWLTNRTALLQRAQTLLQSTRHLIIKEIGSQKGRKIPQTPPNKALRPEVANTNI